MRATIITVVIAGLIMSAGIGCNNDKTELAWENATGTGRPINTIIWANGDQRWERYDGDPALTDNDGYADGTRTEFKKVDKLYGQVHAAIWDNNNFVAGEVIIEGYLPGASLSLLEGSSEVYRITDVQ